METITACILTAVFLLVAAVFFYKMSVKSLNYWTSRGVPCVSGALPVFGNTLPVFALKVNLSTWSRGIYEKHRGQSMVGFYNMTKPTLMLRDPELIKIVLQTSFTSFQHNDRELDRERDPLISRNIFFVRGQEWKDSRAMFVSTLSISRIKFIFQAVSKVCDKLAEYLTMKVGEKDSYDLEAKSLFSRYTTEVAADSVFSIDGHSFGDGSANKLVRAMKMTVDNAVSANIVDNLLGLLPFSNTFFKRRFVPPEVDRYFRKLGNDVAEQRRQDGVRRSDVFQTMLDLVEEGKTSREYALSVAFSFFIEGYETSSLTASFMAYALAKNPKIQETLRREIETVMAKHDDRLTYEAVREMSYMEQVVCETLRLFSPVGHSTKICTEEHRLRGSSDGASLEVEPGTTILIPTMGLHMDPEIWENPEMFEPERFSGEKMEKRRNFVYLPFGDGPRACPGSRLALNQIKAAFATILRNYRIEPSPKMREPLCISPEYALANAVGGFWIRLKSL